MNLKHWIIKGLALGSLMAWGTFVATAESVKVGDTVEVVMRELGKPQGRISSGIHDVYLYDRGKVELKNGLVTSVELVSAEEAAARRLAQEKRQQEAVQRALEAQEQRRAEGSKVLSDRLADTAFRSQSAGDQLEYWDLFKNQYPEIDIGTIYANLSKQYQVEVEQARVREQLADLQQRTAAAEARALRAERAAEEAYWSRPTVTYVSSPWIQSYPRYCPPTYTVTHHSPVKPHYVISKPNIITKPIPISHPCTTIPPTPRKMGPANPSKSGSSTNSPRVTVNVKTGTNIK